MKRAWMKALCALCVSMGPALAAHAVSVSGSLSGGNSAVLNYSCDGSPTCTGTYNLTFVDPQCGAMPQFSGSFTMSGFDPSQPSSGNITLTNFRDFSDTCGIGIFTLVGPYNATSTGGSGSLSVTFVAGGSQPTTLTGSFAVGGASPVRVSGKYGLSLGPSDYFFGSFTCTGMPTCAGTVAFNERDIGCSNAFGWSVAAVFSGLDVSRAGAVGGTVTVYGSSKSTVNADGTCTYGLRDTNAHAYNYSGNWDGSNGTLTVTFVDEQNQSYALPGNFGASGTGVAVSNPPSFPMTVTSSVTPASASATAQIQPRTQDAGTTQSVFVFAHAPATLVKDLVKRVPAGGPIASQPAESAVICVLAQLGSDGQLHAASASTMQAYLTSVLSSQAQAVTVLNNVATPNVAGATMFVGYGANATAMLANGIYQNALSIPGPVQCTASLASAPAPNSPGPLSGLWWNASESGWGISFTQRRNILFAAWYTYDASGNPKWYVASNCAMPAGTTGVAGTCNGDLYAVDGPTFFGTPFNPSAVHVTTAGSLQATFTDANNGSLTYSVAGQTRTLPIARQVFRNGAAPAVDYSDLWYNASESGWGMSITHQSDTMFLAWYVYDSSGKPVWYVAPACAVSGSSCSGSLYRTTGPAFGPTFNPNQVQAFEVGSAIVSFIDANNAVLSYTVNGVTATKTITRQAF